MLKESSWNGFQTSLRCLQHPLSWAGVGLLFINDHFLKGLYPGWFTGKLSDFAGLLFFPFLVALGLSPLFDHWQIRTRVQGRLALVLTGLGFILIKTIPSVNNWIGDWVGAVYGRATYFTLDPTDLVALISFLPGMYIWDHPPRHSRRASALLAVSLAALASLATPPGFPELGVYNLNINARGDLETQTCSTVWVSADGGLRWENQPNAWTEGGRVFNQPELPTQWTEADISNPQILYRFSKGISIERSTDGGQTWTLEFQTAPLTEAQQEYFHSRSDFQCIVQMVQGPLDAVFEPRTGNLVIAMGIEGVLVRDPAGKYQWVTVGEFEHISHFDLRLLRAVTVREALIGITLGALALLAFGLVARARWAWLFLFIPLEGVYAWYMLNQRLDLTLSLASDIGKIHVGGTLLLAGLFAWLGLMQLRDHAARIRWRAAAWSAAAGFGFWLMFALWSTNIIPSYDLAFALAVLIGLILWVVGQGDLRRATP